MTDPIKKQVEGKPLKEKPESAIERRHREMMRALNGEIPNAVYESKRELVELLDSHKAHASNDSRALYDKMTGINMRMIGIEQTVGDIFAEESNFHRDWREAQARLEKHNTRLSSWHLMVNSLRLVVNAGILAVLAMYLMDMG